MFFFDRYFESFQGVIVEFSSLVECFFLFYGSEILDYVYIFFFFNKL